MHGPHRGGGRAPRR